MLNYLDTQNALHTRLVNYSPQQYLFVLQVVLGERTEVAYANTFDVAEFKRNVPSEDEEDYILSLRRDAQAMLETQECKQLRIELESQYHSDIQEAATSFGDWKFSGEDVQKMLGDLLHDRTQDLTEASVRDIVALLKMMYENGALDSGDSFARHFVTIPNKYNALCLGCGHEFYAVEGITMKCPHCGAQYTWDESEHRFIPEIPHL